MAASFVAQTRAAAATFPGRYPLDCGERDWHVALAAAASFTNVNTPEELAAVGGRFDDV